MAPATLPDRTAELGSGPASLGRQSAAVRPAGPWTTGLTSCSCPGLPPAGSEEAGIPSRVCGRVFKPGGWVLPACRCADPLI